MPPKYALVIWINNSTLRFFLEELLRRLKKKRGGGYRYGTFSMSTKSKNY